MRLRVQGDGWRAALDRHARHPDQIVREQVDTWAVTPENSIRLLPDRDCSTIKFDRLRNRVRENFESRRRRSSTSAVRLSWTRLSDGSLRLNCRLRVSSTGAAG
ncbi:Hypothetical protein NTJ_15130 [Nesidiocoris tenuis]|uniref:ZP domain-containing protein n=1 Tax=Nesidiocoris tenuis TaxID=355587 RepID=A0ABN7BD66_9HEMI|nr:Hypothetical protein NTJ_15130 [Nesidiocoris tenuis]